MQERATKRRGGQGTGQIETEVKRERERLDATSSAVTSFSRILLFSMFSVHVPRELAARPDAS